jgi:hypothetical protein
MSVDVIQVAAGLRLGANFCAPHTCPCGAGIDARGIHGLSCARSAGLHLRHTLINDIECRALERANVTAVKESSDLLVGNAMRPDGVTLLPRSRGKCLAWDATTPDTLAASHLPSTRHTAGAAAAQSTTLKAQKCSSLSATHIVTSIAIETLGPCNAKGLSFIFGVSFYAPVRTLLLVFISMDTSFGLF